MVINKYACICSDPEQIKFIKVTCTQMKQVNQRMLYITNVKANRNQMIIEKIALQ